MDTLLVVDDDDGILKLFETALKASFRACLRHPMPLLVYGVLLAIATFVALVPMALILKQPDLGTALTFIPALALGPIVEHFMMSERKLAALLCHVSQHTDAARMEPLIRDWGLGNAALGGTIGDHRGKLVAIVGIVDRSLAVGAAVAGPAMAEEAATDSFRVRFEAGLGTDVFQLARTPFAVTDFEIILKALRYKHITLEDYRAVEQQLVHGEFALENIAFGQAHFGFQLAQAVTHARRRR